MEHGLIKRSRSPYSAPIVLDQKKDQSWRMCIDYTRLNEKTKTNAAAMQDCGSLLHSIPANYWYSVIDCNSGFWQIPLSEDSYEKSAFSTEKEHFEFVVMPFGLKNAPKTFQSLMNNILSDLISKFVGVLMDDIIIYSPTFETHMQHIEEVLKRLKTANLTISLKKSKFAKRTVDYLSQ